MELRMGQGQGPPPHGDARIKAFLQKLETSPQVSKSEVHRELLLIQSETHSKDMELSLEKTMRQQAQSTSEKNPSISKTILSTMVRLAGFGLGLYLVMLVVKKMDFKGGLGGDADMFKDNFQEYHPPVKPVQNADGTTAAQENMKSPADDEDASFSILFNNKQKPAPQMQFDYVSFKDVLGNDDAKEELADLVDYLRNPQKYTDMDLKIPKGILLGGPPGTGKTLLARALAGEAEVPFINVNGSSFVQMFAGLGAQRVRRLFARARELSPCIIFIDEIDALGTRRDSPQNYSRQTLNQLLGEMDGFAGQSGVIVVGATNLAHTLDPALTRPGRFDRTVEVSVPDKKVRKQILQHYLKTKGGDNLDLDLLAGNTTGFTGAELFNLVNRAGIEAVKNNLKKIPQHLLIESQETIMMGRANRDKVMSENTKQIVAYHEAGHALVALYTKSANPIYKATILPRGGALGFVAHTRKDEHLLSKESMLAHMDVCMGGRAAEELIFGSDQVTQGASSDFQQATNMARSMVARYGMSASVGKVYMDEEQEKKDPSVGKEVRKLTDDAYDRATTLLKDKAHQHKLLAEALLQDETLSVEAIKKVVSWKPEDVRPPMSTNDTASV